MSSQPRRRTLVSAAKQTDDSSDLAIVISVLPARSVPRRNRELAIESCPSGWRVQK